MSSSSAMPLQELARLSLNLLEQGPPQALQQPTDRTRTYIRVYLGRKILVQTDENGLGLRTCKRVPNPVTPQRRRLNEPLIPSARKFGNWYAESPLVLMAARRQRQFSSPHETPTGIPRRVPWYPGRGPRSRRENLLATPTRRGNRFPETPRIEKPRIGKLHLKFRKPATRQQLVTEFFALDTKGNPARLF